MSKIRVAGPLLLIIATVVGGTGCDLITGGDDSLSGTYTLQSVNGDPVPAVLDQGEGWTEEVVSGTLTFNDGGTVSFAGMFRYTDSSGSQDFPESEAGTFTQEDGAVTITIDNETVNGTHDDGTLTLSIDGDTWVFEK